MTLPKEYNKALHQEANFYAAWLPLATPFAIGDYGLIQNGVFQKLGHLNDVRRDGFNVKIRTAKGDPIKINFLSQGAKCIKMIAGAAVLDFLPEVAGVDAKLVYEFERENSFVVKAGEILVERMDNVREVADRLAEMRRDDNWKHKYRVVSTTYTGKNCLVLLSSKAGTKVEFEATASALKQLDLGNVEFKPSVSSSSDQVLDIIGKTGVLGLGLFKLSILQSNVKFLAGKPLTPEEKAIEENWGDDLADWDEE